MRHYQQWQSTMGVSTSTLKGYIAHGHSCPDVVRCYPSQTLTKFPGHKGKKQGELIEILRILPKYSVESKSISVAVKSIVPLKLLLKNV